MCSNVGQYSLDLIQNLLLSQSAGNPLSPENLVGVRCGSRCVAVPGLRDSVDVSQDIL
jgi:hypothetical protein